MLYKVFDFADKEVSDVMVPRPDGRRAVRSTCRPRSASRPSSTRPYTRYPVYRESLDTVVGILHVRDLFSALVDRGIANVEVADLVRPAHFVPETKDLAAMLSEFRRTNQHMAIVVDEYGAMEGIVTLEDLLEEIVGEIEDEFDLPDESIERIDDDTIRIDGTFPIDDFNEQFATRDPDRGLPLDGRLRLRSPRARAGARGLGRLRRAPLRRARGRGPAHPSKLARHVRRAPRFAEGSRGRGLARAGPILGRIAPTAFSEISEPHERGRARAAFRGPSGCRGASTSSPASGRRSPSGWASSGCGTIADLLEHRPHRYEAAAEEVRIADLLAGEQEVAISGEVVRTTVRRPRRRLAIVQARIADDSGQITAVWFNQAWLADKLKPGTHVRLRGHLRRNEFNVRSYDLNGASATADFAPVYPATRGSDGQEAARGDRARAAPGARLPGSRPGRSRRRAAAPSRRAHGAPRPAHAGGRGARSQEARVRGAARAPGRARPQAPGARARRGSGARRAGRADRALPRAAPVQLDVAPGARDRGDRRRPRPLDADGAPASGRGRLGQDRRRAVRAPTGGRVGPQRRAHGPDRDARRAALPDARGAVPRARRRGRAPHALGEGRSRARRRSSSARTR